MLHALSELLAAAGGAFVRQLVLGFGLLFAVGALLFGVQRWTQRALARALGWRAVVYWTGWLGTPVHELSHLVVGWVCRVEIEDWKLFQPDERTGVLGYVRYRVPRLRWQELHKVIGTFLMGVAPLFGGSIVLVALWVVLVHPGAGAPLMDELRAFAQLVAHGDPGAIARAFVRLLRSCYAEVFRSGFGNPRAWLFLYAALAVGGHLAPSRADLQGGALGFAALCGLGFLGNLGASAAGVDVSRVSAALAQATMPLTALLLLALVLNIGNLLLAQGLALALGRRRP